MKKAIFALITSILLIGVQASVLSQSKDEAVKLRQQGEIASHKGKYKEAIAYFEQSLKICKEINFTRGIAGNLNQIGNAYEFLGQYEKAIRNHEESLKIYRELNIPQSIATNLSNIGSNYSLLGQHEKALSYYQEAIEIWRKLDSPPHIARSLGKIAFGYASLGRYNQALSYYEEGLKIWRDLDSAQNIAVSLNNIGAIYKRLGQYEKAFEYIKIIKSAGHTHFSLKEYEKSLPYYEEILKTYRELNDSQSIATNLEWIGLIYLHLSQYEQALLKYEEAMKIYREHNNPQGVAKSLFNIAYVYIALSQYEKTFEYLVQLLNGGYRHYSLGEYDEALSYFELALKITREFKISEHTGAVLNGIASVYLSLRQYEQALLSYEEALKIWKELNDSQAIAKCFDSIGLIHLSLKHYDKALSNYKEALKIWKAVKNPQRIGMCLNNIGFVYANSERNEKALSYYKEALGIYKELNIPQDMATIVDNICKIHVTMGHYEQVIFEYKELLKIWEKLDNREGMAKSLNNIGFAYALLERYDEAIFNFQKALEVCRKLKSQRGEATSLDNIGFAYASSLQYKKALSHYEAALKIWEKIKLPKHEFATLEKIGEIYGTRYHLKAIFYFEEALKIAKKLKNKRYELRTFDNIARLYNRVGQYEKALFYNKEALRIARNIEVPQEIAKSLRNLGTTYGEVGQYEKALKSIEEALKIDKEMNNQYAMAVNFQYISWIYYYIGHYEKALYYSEKALKIKREQNLNKADPLYIAGFIYLAKESYEKAEKKLLEAQKELKKIGIKSGQMGLVEVYLSAGDYEKALSLLNKMPLDLQFHGYQDAYLRFLYLSKYGQALKGIGRLEKASHEFFKAVSLIEEMRQMVKARYGFLGVGQHYGGRIRPYRGLVETLSERVIKGQTKDKAFSLYGNDLISAAFYFAELMKARTLLEAIAESARSYKELDIPHELRQEEESLINQLLATEHQWEDIYLGELKKREEKFIEESLSGKKEVTSEVYTEVPIEELYSSIAGGRIIYKLWASKNQKENKKSEKYQWREERFLEGWLVGQKETLKKELASLISKIRKDYPRYAAIKYPKPIPAKDLPIRDNEVLFEYAIGDKASYLFIVKSGGVKKLIKIEKGKDELEALVNTFVSPLMSKKTKEKFSISEGNELYKLLLKEALSGTSTKKKIMIVPDGILGLLPFEVLVTKKGKNYKDSQYVGDTWKISYCQSAAVLALNRILGPSSAKRAFFGLGNAYYSDRDPRYLAYKDGKPEPVLSSEQLCEYAYRGFTTRREWSDSKSVGKIEYCPLPESEDEVRTIAQIFRTKTEPPDVLLKNYANETLFRRSPLKEYQYLHFATHADLPGRVQGIKEPFLLLGQVENQKSDDGFLTLTEVLELKLDANMVVLSACVTGRGEVMEGEGVVNLARAFQHAGSRSVVISLWEVSSAVAVEYMKIFYNYLNEGKSGPEALRFTRKEIKKQYPNPFYWGVFILHGED